MQASSGLDALIRRAYFGSAFIYHPDLRSLYTLRSLSTLALLSHAELKKLQTLKRNTRASFVSVRLLRELVFHPNDCQGISYS